MKTRKLQDKLERHSGKRDDRSVKKFKRSSRSGVVDDGEQTFDTRYYGWREGGGSNFWRLFPKWLKTRVGRRWSDIYSELCEEIKDKDVIHDVVKWQVEFNVSLVDGQLCYLETGFRSGFFPVNSRECFYVYHDILHYSPKPKGKERCQPTNCFVCDDGVFIRKDTAWYEVSSIVVIDSFYARKLSKSETERFAVNPVLRSVFRLDLVIAFNGKNSFIRGEINSSEKRQISSKETKKLLKKYLEADKIVNFDLPLSHY